MNKAEIEDYLQKDYPNIGKIQKIELMKHNNFNSINFKIFTSKSNYVLRNFIDGSQLKKIDQMSKILNYCIKHKAKVHKPVKNSKNNFVNNKHRFYLTKFYEGNFFCGTKKELLDIAKQLAYLHRILSTNTIPYNFRINQNFYQVINSNELKNILKIIQRKKTLNNFDQKILKNINSIQQILFDYERLSLPQQFPKFQRQLIHHDLHPKNVIFSDNQVAAIIDFSTMRKGSIFEDIAFTSYRFASYNSKKILTIRKNIQLFINKYLEFNPTETISGNILYYFFLRKMLGRIGLIIRKNYFSQSDLWTFDFDDHFNVLKLVHKSKIFEI